MCNLRIYAIGGDVNTLWSILKTCDGYNAIGAVSIYVIDEI